MIPSLDEWQTEQEGSSHEHGSLKEASAEVSVVVSSLEDC